MKIATRLALGERPNRPIVTTRVLPIAVGASALRRHEELPIGWNVVAVNPRNASTPQQAGIIGTVVDRYA